jgi:hypothetical protein
VIAPPIQTTRNNAALVIPLLGKLNKHSKTKIRVELHCYKGEALHKKHTTNYCPKFIRGTTIQISIKCHATYYKNEEHRDVPFRLIVTEDDLVAYTTPVGYSQLRKGSQGDLFNVTRLGRVMFLSDIK